MPGFPRDIREQVLVESARHCAVCHRYNAVGVEVHHIEPRAQGGADSEENAIALCFDCHCAAGHYNPSHPKGSRFSAAELLRHKAEWRRIVASGAIRSVESTAAVSLTCRHVVTSDQISIEFVLRMNTAELPFGNFELLRLDPTIDHLRECFGQDALFVGYMDRRSYVGHLVDESSTGFESAVEFHQAHPEFGGAEERRLRAEDAAYLSRQPVWHRAVKEGTDPGEIGRVLAVGGPKCGDSLWREEAVFRVPHGVFLQVRNDSPDPIRIDGLTARSAGGRGRTDFRPMSFRDDLEQTRHIAISPTFVAPGTSLLIPEGVFYGPFEDGWFEGASSHQYAGNIETSAELRVQSFVFDPDRAGPYFETGPWSHVTALDLLVGRGPRTIPVHTFDPRKPFVSIDTVWLAGSCPHVFMRASDGAWLYAGEILGLASSQELVDYAVCDVPTGIDLIRIVELEFETTTLLSIAVDDREIAKDVVLRRGDWFDVPVQPGERVVMQGYYSAQVARLETPEYRAQKYRLLSVGLSQLRAVRSVGRFEPIWRTGPPPVGGSLARGELQNGLPAERTVRP